MRRKPPETTSDLSSVSLLSGPAAKGVLTSTGWEGIDVHQADEEQSGLAHSSYTAFESDAVRQD